MSECRSLTNFIGNAVATVVVSRWEGALDRNRLQLALDGRERTAAAGRCAARGAAGQGLIRCVVPRGRPRQWYGPAAFQGVP